MKDFILKDSGTRLEKTVADQTHFVLSDEQWKEFTEALDRPAKVWPRLRELLTEPSILDKR